MKKPKVLTLDFKLDIAKIKAGALILNAPAIIFPSFMPKYSHGMLHLAALALQTGTAGFRAEIFVLEKRRISYADRENGDRRKT